MVTGLSARRSGPESLLPPSWSGPGSEDTAREVVLEGADYGEEEEDDVPIELGYVRGLPLEKALDPDTLLAHRMSGEVLSTEHGGPLRAIVPGWYAMASVKWLVRIPSA